MANNTHEANRRNQKAWAFVNVLMGAGFTSEQMTAADQTSWQLATALVNRITTPSTPYGVPSWETKKLVMELMKNTEASSLAIKAACAIVDPFAKF